MNEPTRYGNSTNLTRTARLPRQRHVELALAAAPSKPACGRNPDPYNSSGSFDRTQNWARIGKR